VYKRTVFAFVSRFLLSFHGFCFSFTVFVFVSRCLLSFHGVCFRFTVFAFVSQCLLSGAGVLILQEGKGGGRQNVSMECFLAFDQRQDGSVWIYIDQYGLPLGIRSKTVLRLAAHRRAMEVGSPPASYGQRILNVSAGL
jgi:hypothetical protein